jgi:hypothetical protein
MDQFTGGCLCGTVRIVATGQPYRVGICHCLDCRKHHGALFHASAIFPADAVSVDGETGTMAGGISAGTAALRCSGAAVMKSR